MHKRLERLATIWLDSCFAEAGARKRPADLSPGAQMTQTERVTMPDPPADTPTTPILGGAEHGRYVDRRVTLEHFASHLAHELGTPLNVIEGRTALLASAGGSNSDAQRNLRIIAEQCARMARTLTEVMTFIRRGKTASTEVDLAELARSAVSKLDETASRQHAKIAIHTRFTNCSVQGAPDELLVAVTHLLENGLRFTPPGGTLHVRLRCLADAEDHEWKGAECCIDVDDEGPGISAELMPHFKPFTLADSSGDKLGLGLFIAHSVAKEHGGWLEAVNRAGAGARFTLHLPRGPGHVD